MGAFLERALPPTLALGGFLAILEVLTRALDVPAYLVPPPSAVLVAALQEPSTLLVGAMTLKTWELPPRPTHSSLA